MRLSNLSRPRAWVALGVALATTAVALAQQPTLVGTLDGHVDPVYSIAWTPDGKAIVTGGFDSTLRYWDAETRKELKKYDVQPATLVLSVSPSPDGTKIATGSLDKSARIWLKPGSAATKSIDNLPAGSHALASSPDGKRVAFAAAKTVNLWDMIAPVPQALNGHAADIESLAWRGDGAQVASGDKGRAIRLWNGPDGAPQGLIETPSDTVLGLAYHPNNAQLISAGSDGLARLWQLPLVEPKVVEAKGPVKVVAFSLDGNRVATAGDDKIVRVWNVNDGALIKEIPAPDQPVVAVALKSDGSQVVFALANKTIRVCNVADGAEVKKIENVPTPVTALAFQMDGGRFATAGEDNQIRVYDVATIKEVKAMPGHTARINTLVWAPNDANALYSGSADKTAKMWNINEGKPARDFPGHGDAVTTVTTTRNGVWIATGSADKAIRIFQTGDAKLLATVNGHAGPVTSVGFSENNTRLASGSADNTVRFWDITNPAAPRELQDLSAHAAAIVGVPIRSRATCVASSPASTARLGSKTRSRKSWST